MTSVPPVSEWKEQLREWATRYVEERAGWLLVYREATRWNLSPAREHAEDALQDAFCQLFRTYDNTPGHYRDYRHFRNSVTRIACNLLCSLARRRWRIDLGLEGDNVAAPEAADPRPEALHQCIAQLSPEARALLEADFWDGLTLDQLARLFLAPDQRGEIARRSDIVRRLVRAREDLREVLLREYPELEWPEDSPRRPGQ